MESLNIIRQMMAESKFSEAEKLIEVQLVAAQSSAPSSLLSLYFECLEAQQKELPAFLLFEHVKKLFEQSPTDAFVWFEKLTTNKTLSHLHDFQILKMVEADKLGNLEELRRLIHSFQLSLVECHVPRLSAEVSGLMAKYFAEDVSMSLAQLALHLALGDEAKAVALAKEILLHTFERSSLKSKKERLQNLQTLITAHSFGGELILIRNLCSLLINGIQDKKDYKGLAELVIYLDEFSLQVLILHLLQSHQNLELASQYAKIVRKNSAYSFVYLAKYFPELKIYFSSAPSKPETPATPWQSPDLTLEQKTVSPEISDMEEEVYSAEELHFVQLLKHQDYSVDQLCEVAVSFLQSQYPRIANHAVSLAMQLADSDESYLKAAYLKLTCLMQLKDFRGALDLSLQALERSHKQEDVLSIMYSQAEAYLRLGHKNYARQTLKRILSIDENYRLTKQRLEKLT